MTLTTEQNLLLACLQPRPDAASMADMLQNRVDWDALIALAGMHGVIPIVYRAFHIAKPAQLPLEVVGRLQQLYQQNTVNSLRIVSVMMKILQRFSNQDITAIPFRGPVLSHLIHGNAAIRQCGDLDLLIRRQDLERAKNLLLEDGFTTAIQQTQRQEELCIKHSYSLHFVRDRDGANIDLHWNIAPAAFSRYFDFDEIAGRCQTTSLDGHALTVLSAMDWLMLLSIHAAKHLWSRLLWLHDLRQLVDTFDGQIDWPATLALAHKTDDSRPVIVSLMLCHDLLGLYSVDHIIEQELVNDKKASKIKEMVLDKLFSQHEFLETEMWMNLVSFKTINHVRLKQGLRNKMSYLIDKILFRIRFG